MLQHHEHSRDCGGGPDLPGRRQPPADLLELTLNEQRIVELEEHLAGCECRAYLNPYRRTKELIARMERAKCTKRCATGSVTS